MVEADLDLEWKNRVNDEFDPILRTGGRGETRSTSGEKVTIGLFDDFGTMSLLAGGPC